MAASQSALSVLEKQMPSLRMKAVHHQYRRTRGTTHGLGVLDNVEAPAQQTREAQETETRSRSSRAQELPCPSTPWTQRQLLMSWSGSDPLRLLHQAPSRMCSSLRYRILAQAYLSICSKRFLSLL